MKFRHIAIKKPYWVAISIALAFVAVIFVIVILGFHSKNSNESLNQSIEKESKKNTDSTVESIETDPQKDQTNESQKNTQEKDKNKVQAITGLLIGVDKSKGLTDVIMVAHFDPNTNKIKLISIPRDLYIDFEDPMFSDVKKENEHIKITHCKITEVYGNAGEDRQAIKSLEQIASDIVDIPIQYYALIDLEGFKSLVDLVDGVEVTVPYNMNYEDPLQNLYIHLKKGTQVLDGKHAEMLVRYRGGPENDFGRIKMQHTVMKELSKKLLGIRDFSKFVELIKNINKYLKTDFNLLDGIKYSKYVFDLNLQEVLTEENMITLPTESVRLDYWYEILKKDEAKKMINELLHNEDK